MVFEGSEARWLVVVMIFALLVTSGAFAQADGAGMTAGRLSSQAPLLSDSLAGAEQVAWLTEGTHLTIFPEMSNDDFFFVMADGVAGDACHGWVPTASVQMVEAQFGDVPKGHWASEALKRLSSEGLVDVDKNGFHGDKAVTRYELTMVLDRYMDRLSQVKGAFMAAIEAIPFDRKLDINEANKLDRLVKHLEGLERSKQHLGMQMAQLSERVEQSEIRLDVVEETQIVQGESIDEIVSKVQKVDGFHSRLAKVEQRVNGLERGGVVAHEIDFPEQPNVDVDRLRNEINELKQRLERMEKAQMVAQLPNVEEERMEDAFPSEDFDIPELEESPTPEMMSGVRASSMRIESTSSTIA